MNKATRIITLLLLLVVGIVFTAEHVRAQTDHNYVFVKVIKPVTEFPGDGSHTVFDVDTLYAEKLYSVDDPALLFVYTYQVSDIQAGDFVLLNCNARADQYVRSLLNCHTIISVLH